VIPPSFSEEQLAILDTVLWIDTIFKFQQIGI
jgi:hypothetical protein